MTDFNAKMHQIRFRGRGGKGEEGSGGEGKEGPQVTVEPGLLGALLHHCTVPHALVYGET